MGNIRSRFLGNLIHNSSLYNFRENWKRGWDNVGFDPFSFYIFILIVSPLMQCYCLFSFSKEREVFRDFFEKLGDTDSLCSSVCREFFRG